MSLRDFIAKQWIDVIQWTEPEDGVLAYRYPMQDMEIQNGGSLPFANRRWPRSSMKARSPIFSGPAFIR